MPLKRTLSLTLLSFYGLGTILGAGIYALIGEVTQKAEEFTPFSFLIACILALFTALSYAELSARYPQSAGSALYVYKAFNKRWLAGIVGWLVVFTGVVSAATISHGFAQYFQLLVPGFPLLSITILVLLLGGLAILGIYESAALIMIMTLIEILGLLIIILYGYNASSPIAINLSKLPQHMNGIFMGAFLAFYAYIGFEDMVNTAEEAINPKRNMPIAIFVAVIAATILYILVSWTIVTNLSTKVLTNTKTPMIAIIQQQGHSAILFTIIALIAIVNGILVQIIMASRLLYGMAKQLNAPALFSIIYEKTQTPVYATLAAVTFIILFAWFFPIVTLAKLTSTIMLSIFIIIHLSLIKIKLTHNKKAQGFSVPIILPFISLGLTLLFFMTLFL